METRKIESSLALNIGGKSLFALVGCIVNKVDIANDELVNLV